MKSKLDILSFLKLLGLLFIGLKLSHQIDWSWWLILLPIYVVEIFSVVLATVLVVGARLFGFANNN